MARIPTRFHGPAQVSNVAATKYTVNAAEMIELRNIHISNPSGSAVTFTLSIGADTAAVRLFDAYSIPANSITNFFCYHPANTAEIIQAFAGTNNVLVLVLSGTRLVLG